MLDKGSIEYIGPFGLELALVNLSKKIAQLDSGVITSYALYILSGLILYILIYYISIFQLVSSNDNNILILFIFFGLLYIIRSNDKTNSSVSFI